MTTALLIAAWIVSGVLAYGIDFAYFQRQFPHIAKEDYLQDMAYAMLWGLGGALTMSIGFFLSGFAKHGLKFW